MKTKKLFLFTLIFKKKKYKLVFSNNLVFEYHVTLQLNCLDSLETSNVYEQKQEKKIFYRKHHLQIPLLCEKKKKNIK